jgi:hypothetical protein
MKSVRFVLVDGTKHEVQIPVGATVEGLVQKAADQVGAEPSNVRLILRGTVLKDPRQPFAQTQFKPSDVLICNVLCPPTVLPEQRPIPDAKLEDKVATLVEMGFPEAPSREALRRHNGRIEEAAAALAEAPRAPNA